MLSLILTLAIIGAIAYAIITYIPMPQPIKTAIIIVIAICVIVFLMRAFGVADIPVPQVR